MARRRRICPAGDVFHVLNRAVARLTIFEKPEDYNAFLRVLHETWLIVPISIYSMMVMPNHWHFVVQPRTDDEVTEFFRRLTLTHTMRWHAHYETSGTGHLYQGRFKSFPIQSDHHLLRVMRYVERNPVRAGLAELAQSWLWGSAFARSGNSESFPWLVEPKDPSLPQNWLELVNRPETEAELLNVRQSVQRGIPFGDDQWVRSSVVRLGLESSLRPHGRPRVKPAKPDWRPPSHL
jgi:putative transposase